MHEENNSWIPMIVLLSLFVLGLTMYWLCIRSTINAGERWIYTTGNPFLESYCEEQNIVAVKNGYVKYSIKNIDGLHCCSSAPVDIFKAGSHLATHGEHCPDTK
jgi:hypothetical protein